MKNTLFLLILFFASCSGFEREKSVPVISNAMPEYKTIVEPTITDTIRVTQRVEVPVMWSWQDDSTQAKQIVQPGENLEAGNINLSGMIGPYKFTMMGTITLPIDVTVTPNEPDDTTNSGNDPPVVVPPAESAFKIGTNTFPWFRQSLVKDAGLSWVRVYFASGWAWRLGGLHIQPMWQASTPEAWGMDDYLKSAKANGINVLWCNHQTPEWYRNTGRSDGNNDFAPIPAGAKRNDALSFKDYASYCFQIAARYGEVKHEDSVLKTDPESRWNGDQTQKASGLKLLKYFQGWNEEKWWLKGTEGYIEPETMAALMSAVYDGHEGRLGPTAGIKTADPSMIVVMPPLTDYDFPYLLAMDAWFKANRTDKKWACDIADMHHYSNKGNKYKQHPAQWVNDGGCPPSEDKNFEAVREVVAFFGERGLKLWVSEFGYDTKPPSQMHIVGRAGQADEQAQAVGIVESIKAYKSAGVDAVFIFNSNDDIGAADGGQFETSGLYSSQATGYKPKPVVGELKKLVPLISQSAIQVRSE